MPHVSELHAQHDPILMVSLASGDLAPADRDLAQSLLATCDECAHLHEDVLAIARATAAIPPAVRTTDFRLTPEQAATLRPAGWRRFLAALTSPGQHVTRQLGVGLTTIGIAGLLIGTLPSISLGGNAASAPSAPAAAGAESGNGPAASRQNVLGPVASPAASAGFAGGDTTAVDASGAPATGEIGVDSAAGSQEPTRAYTDGAPGVKSSPGASAKAQAPGTVAPDTGRELAAPGEPPSPEGPSGIVIASAALLGAGVLLLLANRFVRRPTSG